MDLRETGNLLEVIAVNYPAFAKHISDGAGKMRKDVAEEWMRHLGFLDYEEALDRLDQHMESEDGYKIPKPMDLRKFKGQQKKERDQVFHAPIEHKWHLEFMAWDHERKHGRLYDQNEYEYVHDPTYEDGYHYDQQGHICTFDGRVVFV